MRRPTAARQRVVSDDALPAFPREHRTHDDGPYRLLHREHHRLLAAARLATPSGTRENSATTRARANRERFSTARSAEQNACLKSRRAMASAHSPSAVAASGTSWATGSHCRSRSGIAGRVPALCVRSLTVLGLHSIRALAARIVPARLVGNRSAKLSITHILMASHPGSTISCVAGIVRDSLSGTESRARGAGHGGSVV